MKRKKKKIIAATLEDFRIHDIIGDLVDIGFLGQYSNEWKVTYS